MNSVCVLKSCDYQTPLWQCSHPIHIKKHFDSNTIRRSHLFTLALCINWRSQSVSIWDKGARIGSETLYSYNNYTLFCCVEFQILVFITHSKTHKAVVTVHRWCQVRIDCIVISIWEWLLLCCLLYLMLSAFSYAIYINNSCNSACYGLQGYNLLKNLFLVSDNQCTGATLSCYDFISQY